jgi:hypothetical protein
MIRLQRTMKVKRGKHATEWAQGLTGYVNSVIGKPNVGLFRQRFGNPSILCWTVDFEDIADLESWRKKIGSDAGYRELMEKSFDIIIDGTVEDTVLESL